MTAHKVLIFATILAAFVYAAQLAPAQSLTTIASFNGTNGQHPQYGFLVRGTDGSLYGTTLYGGITNFHCGSVGCGTVFKLAPNGTLTALYNFCTHSDCSDGFYPLAGLVQGTDGNFYGTTSEGGYFTSRTCNGIAFGAGAGCGGSGCGIVWELSPQ